MRNKIPDCVAPRWNETKKETVLFAFGGERPREQDAVGGARLTIEIGADFPIGPKVYFLCCRVNIMTGRRVDARPGGFAMHYKLPLVFEPQPEGGFTVTSPLLPELITEGDTVEDALVNVRDALAAVIL